MTRLAYDPVGNVTSRTDPRSITVNYAYDAEDRLIQKSYPDTSLLTSVTDPLNHTTTTNRDSFGNITSVVDPAGAATSFT